MNTCAAKHDRLVHAEAEAARHLGNYNAEMERGAIVNAANRILAAANLSVRTSRERDTMRAWLNITGPGERYDSLASLEISRGGFHLGWSFRIVDDCEGGLRLHLGLGPAQVFVGSDHWAVRRVAQLLAPRMQRDFYGRSSAKLGAELYVVDGDLVARLYLFNNEDSSKGPAHYYNIKNILLGDPVYTPADGDVSMRTLWLPEGPYELRLTKSHATWKRPRWPWTRHAKSYGWEVVSGPGGRTGLPVPSKGENSYDIDEDAIYGGGMAGDDPEEVVGKIGADVMRTRARRAGSDWRPEPRDAIEDLTES